MESLENSEIQIVIRTNQNSPVDRGLEYTDGHRLVTNNGKHTAWGVQQLLTMHTELFDEQVPLLLLQDSRIEHRTSGAQKLVLFIVR